MDNNETIIKTCTKCGKQLPATTEYFHKKKSGKYGLHAICKKCIKEYNKQRFENNRDEILQKNREYNHNNKEKISEYNKRYYNENKDKKKELSKKYREKNKDKYKEYNKNYRKNNPEKIFNYRQKERGCSDINLIVEITKEQWQIMLEFFDNKCAYSGEELTEDNFSTDHIIPLSKGGSNSINNIVPCTRSVNISKWNRDLEDWYNNKEFFSNERLSKIYKWIAMDI